MILPHNLMVIRGGGWQTSTKNNVRGAAPAGKFPAPPNTPRPAKGFRTFRPVRQPSP